MGVQAGPIEGNLIVKAAHALAERVEGLRWGAFRLIKRLPAAAGVGGGSSDAAAALRLLARLNDLPLDHPAVRAAARATGADVPVCLAPCARMMAGAGERIGPALRLPRLFGVLVNPGVPVETSVVFKRLGLRPGEFFEGDAHPAIESDLTRDDPAPTPRAGAQRSRAAGARLRARHRRGARPARGANPVAASRACRARARPCSGCSTIAGPRLSQQEKSGASGPPGG